MAIRFVIGRAGSGKTRYCLEAIRERLRHDPADGPRLILLVPEQASLQMERAILEADAAKPTSSGLGAAHRAEVLSFQRLAYRVLDSLGGATRCALTEPARTMVLRHLLARRANELRFYRRAAPEGASPGRLGGFLGLLGETIGELIQEGVAPEELIGAEDAQSDPVVRRAGDDPAQRAKLHDLRLLYGDYLAYLGAERLDPSQHLQIAIAGLPRCTWLAGAELWVDGFASLSGLEKLTLIALAKMCRQCEITVLMDPSLGDAGTSITRVSPAAGRLFSRTAQTYGDLHDRFIRAGLEVEDPLVLIAEPPRFRANPSIAALERSLFVPNACPARTSAQAEACGSSGQTIPRVELAELPSRRLEVDYAVSRVCRWVQDPASRYRYRDIAVIARDMEPYHDLLSEALAARGIPFFIDRRRAVAHHPLIRLLRTGTGLAAEEMSLESVRVALKTGLLPITTEAADELENYLVAHGISGLDAWRGDDWRFERGSLSGEFDEKTKADTAGALARINQTRRKLLSSVDSWLGFASSQAHTGAAWSQGILDWFSRLQIDRQLKRWADEAEAEGELDQAEEHRQVWRDVISFLDDLAYAFADVSLTKEELADVLEAGLSRLTLGLVPPMVDQVLVGSIERSRHPDIKAAVVLGFNDGVFPKQLTEDPVLNDDDRTVLKETGVGVRPGSRERAADEPLLLYVALTRASEALVVTYATADSNGKALRPSPYLSALFAACPGLAPTLVADPARARETWDIFSMRDLAGRLAMEFRSRPTLACDDHSRRGRFNELYEAVRSDMGAEAASRRAMASLIEEDAARVSPNVIERLYHGTMRTSVSQLETYAACPFQHFSRYILRLRERAEAALKPLDVGLVHHAVLEDFVRGLSTRGGDFGRLSEGELLDALRESCTRVATRLPESGVLSDARNSYMLRRSGSRLARIIRAQQKLSRLGTARPHTAELAFGFDKPGSLPALELSTPAGRRVLLRGYIDRVDLVEFGDELLGIVVDYKRTREKRLDLSWTYHGLSLQLLGYLLALGEAGETLAGRPIRPIAALYVSLGSQYHGVDHPNEPESREAALEGTYRPRGLLLADKFSALDTSAAEGWSDGYSLFRKKDGTVGHINESDAADAPSFRAMLDHTRKKLGELADGILDGDVAVNPYRLGGFSPCSWCPMPSVCRFEMGISDVRFLSSLKRSEVFQRLIEKQS